MILHEPSLYMHPRPKLWRFSCKLTLFWWFLFPVCTHSHIFLHSSLPRYNVFLRLHTFLHCRATYYQAKAPLPAARATGSPHLTLPHHRFSIANPVAAWPSIGDLHCVLKYVFSARASKPRQPTFHLHAATPSAHRQHPLHTFNTSITHTLSGLMHGASLNLKFFN